LSHKIGLGAGGLGQSLDYLRVEHLNGEKNDPSDGKWANKGRGKV
jgi:hypothetical protein